MRERLFKRLIDVFVLVELKKKPMSGYDVISLLHEKYEVLVSPGTVYALLYSLEREGLIEGRLDERKRVYGLTSHGLEDECLLKAATEEVQLLLANLKEAEI
jgi:DNA-binding PadR family transcriptional regulator